MIAVTGLLLTLLMQESILNGYITIFKFLNENNNWWERLFIIILFCLIILFFVGLFLLLATLNPRISNKEFINNGLNVYFFGSVAEVKYSYFSRNHDVLMRNPEGIICKLKEQIYNNSIIANKKYLLFRYGLYCVIFSFIGLVLFYIFGIYFILNKN